MIYCHVLHDNRVTFFKKNILLVHLVYYIHIRSFIEIPVFLVFLRLLQQFFKDMW